MGKFVAIETLLAGSEAFGETTETDDTGQAARALAAPLAAVGTTYSLTPSSVTRTEGDTTITFTVTRSGNLAAETIYASTLFDTASSGGGDYDPLVNHAVVFSTNETSETFTVSINEDSLVEGTEHFRVMIGATTSAGSSQALDISDVYIEDDDQATTYSLTPGSVTRTEDNSSITFTVTRSGSLPAETLYASTLFDTASSSSGDYDAMVNQAVVFSAGETSETFTVGINEDSQVENTEHFRVMIGATTSAGSSQALDISDVYIQDDDAVSTSYSLTPSTTSVTEGGQVTFTITRSGDTPAERVFFSAWQDSASYAEGDYRLSDGREPLDIAVDFAAGETSRTVTMSILQDGQADAGEQFRAIVQSNPPSSDPAVNLAQTGLITIQETAQSTTYTLTPATTSVAEGNQITFTVTRSGDKPAETIYASTINGAANGYAVNNGDYATNVNNLALTFASGQTSKTFTVTVNDDAEAEGAETFGVVVQRSSDDPPSVFLDSSTFTISANDQGSGSIDDFADEPSDVSASVGIINIGTSKTGVIGAADHDDTYGDKDVFKVTLQAGQSYDIRLTSTTANGPALPVGLFTIRSGDDFGAILATSAAGSNVVTTFTADTSGDYYIRVGSGGSATDQGGYRLSVTTVAGSAPSDDFADYPGDAGSIGALTMGGSRTGVIEASGDKDTFQVSVVAGHEYTFVLTGEQIGANTSLSSVYLTLRDGSDFYEILEGQGGQQAAFSYTATETGQLYLRAGSGGDGGNIGAYRLSVSDSGLPPPESPPPENPTLEDLNAWVSSAILQLKLDGWDFLTSDEPWYLFKLLGGQFSNDELYLFARGLGDQLSPLGLAINGARLINAVILADDPLRAIIVELGDAFAAWSFGHIGGAIGAGAGFLAGGIGAIAGVILGEVAGQWIYEEHLSNKVRDEIGYWYDHIDLQSLDAADGLASAGFAAADADTAWQDALVRFDEEYYLATYPDARIALASGSVGSAYAHFITVGIDLGYRPNAGQTISRADLAFSVINNDAAAVGNTALFTQQLGRLAGDWASTAERDVAALIKATSGPVLGAELDGLLSAIAHRKALDLVTNAGFNAVDEALAAVNSEWAADWSNGAAFEQYFTGALASVVGEGDQAGQYAMFVIADPTGDPAVVLAKLATQQGWGEGAYDTFGIAEYGGLWVVIVADASPGYVRKSMSADTLLATAQYGAAEADTIYAGMRAGTLYGLDGDDLLIGSGFNDVLVGGDGADVLSGAAGADRLVGDLGADVLIGGAGADALIGGGGIDVASYENAAAAIRLNFLTGGRSGDAAGDSYSSIERFRLSGWDDYFVGAALNDQVYGGQGADRLSGQGGTDTLWGEGGDDRLLGDAGADVIYGGAGADVITGGEGADRLYGETGADIFVFNSPSDSAPATRDRIYDFNPADGDRIDLRVIDANPTLTGNQAFTLVAAFTGAAGEARFAYSAGSNLTNLMLDVDGDGVADFSLLIVGQVTTGWLL